MNRSADVQEGVEVARWPAIRPGIFENLPQDSVSEVERAGRPLAACLVPVRDGERDLPGWLTSVRRFADVVVALDDGSTDRTAELLEADPLVKVVLRNSRRGSYAGWDDGENRRRLLEAAADLEPEWVVFLDVDERLDAGDAWALRGFLETDAIPGCAYGFQHFRMWGRSQCDPEPTYVWRAFAWSPGLELPKERLHFDPVPVSIPREAWVPTTIRVRHLAAADDARRLARLRKYAEADPERRYRTNFGGLDEVPATTVPWRRRPAKLPALVPTAELARLRDLFASEGTTVAGSAEADRPLLACLLPVRDGARDLPGWFESVRRFADAVVALDDGSVDGTAELLEAEPLVQVLLRQPRREGHAGWDDGTNRRALLEAAGKLRPRWVVFLDADERIDSGDAAALREFLESGTAADDRAYGFLVHRVTEDLASWDRAGLWAYRLFAWRPGLELPEGRLHAVPVPASIAPERYTRTTVRIQHLGGATEERRRDRYRKYREADPGGDWQSDYAPLLEPPTRLHPWTRRPADLPVVADFVAAKASPFEVLGLPGPQAALDTSDLDDLEAPALSAVIIARDDEHRIERVVRSVVTQEVPEPFEVIVVVSGADRTAEIVLERFPEVAVVELDRPALPGQARNAGLAVARGDYVSFPGSHVELPPGSLAARLKAHRAGHPMVTGTTLNGTDTPAGWASYFLDHSSVLPGRPSEPLAVPPAHCSYERELLLAVGGFPGHLRAGEDTVVNHLLYAMGARAWRAAEVEFVHASLCRTPARLLRHHFTRGRAHGRILLEHTPPGGRVLNREELGRIGLAYLPTRLGLTERNVRRWGGADLEERYRRVRPLVVAGAAAAWTGLWFELLRPVPGKLRALLGARRSTGLEPATVRARARPRPTRR
jgi:glycosyltransferase involved in cell wall biosynthesis